MNNAVKVGLFALIALVVLGGLILRVEDLRFWGPEPTTVDVLFDTVTGLDDKAAVRVAGVRVGRVDGISLEGSRARVHLQIEEEVALTEGSYASISNVGMLGDKYVELFLGRPGGQELPPGTTLRGEVPVTWDQAMAKLSTIGDSILDFTGGITGQGESGSLSRLLDNLDVASAELRTLITANRNQVDSTIDSFETFSATLAAELPRIANQMERTISEIQSVVVDNREDFGEGLANIRELSERFKSSVDNLNDITGTLARGEGSIGKLLKSEEAHDSLVSTMDSLKTGVDGLKNTLGRIDKIQLDLGFDARYLENQEDTRIAFSLNIDPQSQRFYRVEFADDPSGRIKKEQLIQTVTRGDADPITTITDTTKIEDTFSLSAQLGFELGQFAFRGGLIESTGGAGLDYTLPTHNFRFSLDAFDFDREQDLAPRLRLTAKWLLHENIFLVGGYDDLLETNTGSIFLGAGIKWNDDELKYLLGSVPTSF